MRISRWVWELSDVITVDEEGTPSAECREDADMPGTVVVGGWEPIDRGLDVRLYPGAG